jgi:hypothetical protein
MNFKIQSTNELVTFLKRFQSISNTLLLEIDGDCLKAKTHTPEKSVVKYSKIDLNLIFEYDADDISDTIMIGIYSLDKLIKAFSHFTSNEVTMRIETENVDGQNVGVEIILKSPELEITFPCASLRLFTHISDDLMHKIANTDAAEVDFVLTKDIQSKIASLGTIDSDQKILTFQLNKGVLSARGKSYNYNLCQVDNTKVKLSTSVYKNQFAFLDKEDAKTFISDDRLIFHSLETNTILTLGKVE